MYKGLPSSSTPDICDANIRFEKPTGMSVKSIRYKNSIVPTVNFILLQVKDQIVDYSLQQKLVDLRIKPSIIEMLEILLIMRYLNPLKIIVITVGKVVL